MRRWVGSAAPRGTGRAPARPTWPLRHSPKQCIHKNFRCATPDPNERLVFRMLLRSAIRCAEARGRDGPAPGLAAPVRIRSDTTISVAELILPAVLVRDSFLGAMEEFRREGRGRSRRPVDDRARDSRVRSSVVVIPHGVRQLRGLARCSGPTGVASARGSRAVDDSVVGRGQRSWPAGNSTPPYSVPSRGGWSHRVRRTAVRATPWSRDRHADSGSPDRGRAGHRVGPHHLRCRQRRLPQGDRTCRRGPGGSTRRQASILGAPTTGEPATKAD